MRTPLPLRVAVLAAAMIAAAIVQPAAQTTADSSIYRLEKDSTYEDGCFGPCDCAVSQASVRGTFVLTSNGSDPLFTYYNVSDVNWTVALGNPELRITGSGTYKIGGEFAVEQRLEMDLTVGTNSPQHFDSGPVYDPSDFPTIDITISLNGGQACHDTVIHIDAKPVPPAEIHPYALLKGSTFQRGCFAPCLCPIQREQPLSGAFELVELLSEPTVTEFAVVDVRWLATSADGTSGDVPVRGYGTYRLLGQPAAEQQLGLDLTVDGEPETHYDSGQVQGGSDFPRIETAISINGGYCYDTVITINAAPSGGVP